ncbi:trehalose-phosphatase [Ectothiorhodospiraceae bacterium 2226]|nr:trehalose-phosphatase [Ectothiorhodospiraceae bacterium 2226]
MQTEPYEAAILDMDGVITQTATLHARAWKRLFDAFLAERTPRAGEDLRPFDSDHDYRRYVDGKPRYDGVRSFLEARGIALPEGHTDDPPEAQSVRGLGNRKDALFHALLREQGAQAYPDAVAQVRAWKARGLKVAVISSSRNCSEVLESAGVRDLFDAQVDGRDLDRLGLPGKPAPDMFLHAAAKLGVTPARALIVEDALSGVEAGRAGGFALVVGVARNGHGEELRAHGADRVVRDLRELDAPPDALAQFDALAADLGGRPLALFLDYDGTLTPIVARPELATLAPEMRALLARLAGHVSCTVAIVSGRDLADVRAMVDLDALVYAGSHGFDIAGPDGLREEHPEAQHRLSALDAAEAALRAALADVADVLVERKRYAIAVHYRAAQTSDVPLIERRVRALQNEFGGLRLMAGKKIFELQPDVGWDKGRAVLWLRAALDLEAALTLYLGDDVTDEDAFRALDEADAGFGIRVGEAPDGTRAHYSLRDTDAVQAFLTRLAERLDGGAP